MMETQERIDQINDAETKNDLERIAEDMGLKVNMRKSREVLREELLEQAEGDEGIKGEGNDARVATVQDVEWQGQTFSPGDDPAAPSPEHTAQQLAADVPPKDDREICTTVAEAPAVQITAGTDGNPPDTSHVAPRITGEKNRPRSNGRLLRNTRNGRTFMWTAMLAERRDMEEVTPGEGTEA